MKYGCCIYPNFNESEEMFLSTFKALARSGFDYVELPLSLVSQLSDDEFGKLKKALDIIPCLACNLFFPSSLTIVGPDMDTIGITAYLERMLPLAKKLGVETLVFGNGGARKIQEGQNADAILADLRKIVEIMDNYAKKEGITIAVEPLNTTETNIILSYTEGVNLTKGLTHVKTMVDSYHTAMNNQTFDDVYIYPKSLGHLHTAYPVGRMVPSPNDDMALYTDFVKMVKDLGYNDKISVEGSLYATEPAAIEKEYTECISTLRSLFD